MGWFFRNDTVWAWHCFLSTLLTASRNSHVVIVNGGEKVWRLGGEWMAVRLCSAQMFSC